MYELIVHDYAFYEPKLPIKLKIRYPIKYFKVKIYHQTRRLLLPEILFMSIILTATKSSTIVNQSVVNIWGGR